MEHYHQENREHRGIRVPLGLPPETPFYSHDASNQIFAPVPFFHGQRPQKPAIFGSRHGVQGPSAVSAGNDFNSVPAVGLLSEEGEEVGVESGGRGAARPTSSPYTSGVVVGARSKTSNPSAVVSTSSATSKSGYDSSTRSISSMAEYWVPEVIKRYCRDHGRNTASCKGGPTEFRRYTVARNTLLVVLAVAVVALLVGMSADVCKRQWNSGADRSQQMNLRRDAVKAAGGVAGKPAGAASPVSKSASTGIKAQDNELSAQATGTAEEPMGMVAPIPEGQEPLDQDKMNIAGGEVSPTKPRIQEKMAGNSKHRARTTSADVNNAPERSRCGAFAFSYCHSPSPEFYYNQVANACVPVATGHVGLCSRGRNRFTSKRSCREACVESKSRPEHCLVRAVFEKCNRNDVRREWWHFDGHACRSWNFSSGLCPSHRRDVFSSQRDCLAKCGARNGKLLCRAATPEACYSEDLRFPYYAIPGPKALCLRVSAVNHFGRRCLTGPNRFDSIAACQQTCVTSSLRG